MMRKILYLFLLGLIFNNLCFAQTSTVTPPSGIVSDVLNGDNASLRNLQ